MTTTILIVDDQPQISKILNDVLTKKGYSIVMAFNGEAGYQKALEIRPNLIIMDIMMPVLSGFDSAKKIKSHAELENIPIIFLTAKGLDSDKDEADKLNAVGFVTKPFSPKSLLALVESILGNT
ncbi:MAG: response regulator [Spirochaetia bacterium]|nr:response regulator [Spirochaetia bacterium]